MPESFPIQAAASVPAISIPQMIEVDRLMVEYYRIELIQMMENAGRALARLATARFLYNKPAGKRIAVLCGKGGNGGGALVCARRLAAWGARPTVFLSVRATDFGGIPAHQLTILRQMGLPVNEGASFNGASFELLIDGLIGYSLYGAPRGMSAQLIQQANRSHRPILALDIPSGLHGDGQHGAEPLIRAAATLTLALPKRALYLPAAKKFIGDLYLADIGVPPQLYARAFNLKTEPLFAESDIVRLTF